MDCPEGSGHPNYQVIAVASAAAALGTLRDLAGSGVEVALVFADERMAGMNAVDFLVRARDLHPGAKRVLLIERGDWSAVHPAVSAMALGKIDYHLYDPWHPPERILYQAVGEFLAAWEKSREPPSVAFRIVGPAHSPRAHQLRDVLSRAGVPYWFFDDGSEEGRRLLREYDVEGSGVPVAIHYDGTVLVDPAHAELMGKLGMRTSIDLRSCDVVIIGAGGRPGGRGLRGVGRTQHAGPGTRRARWPGRDEFIDPQLPRVPARASAGRISPTGPLSRRGCSGRTSCSPAAAELTARGPAR